MATLSRDQIAMYARAAGLSGDAVDIAVAVALAESSGRTTVHNRNPATGDDSYGLWQINMRPEAGGPQRRAALGLSSDRELLDPMVNARAMAMISRTGRDWSPWSTYSRPPYAYRAYLRPGADTGAAPALDAQDLLEGLVPGGAAITGGGGLVSLAELGIGAARWLSDPRSWVRVAQVAVGAGLVLAGVQMTVAGRALPGVLGTAADVVPGGGVVKKAAQAAGREAAA